mmetsp:Transcript_26325/g.47730  ORF Transcript_26325/g.47730 Transcript_26325/m.47730 type:complete len:125 (+) Transcript_26325:116-490(+)
MIGSPIDAVIHDGGISPCVIEVVGVGGGGCNAIDRMLDTRVSGVDFWAINTDAQALGRSKAKGVKVLNVGTPATRGLGVGGNPDVRQLAADESRADIAAKTSCRQEEDEQASHNAVACPRRIPV